MNSFFERISVATMWLFDLVLPANSSFVYVVGFTALLSRPSAFRMRLDTNSGPVSFSNWSGWRSLKLDVENPYREPFSVYVRTSDRPDYPPDETYIGGTFDGYVMGLWGRL